jgi:hypothetical protein
MPLHVSAVTRPSAGGSAQMLFGVITFVGCVSAAAAAAAAAAVHPTHVITPNSICAEPPEDGRVAAETCRGTDS